MESGHHCRICGCEASKLVCQKTGSSYVRCISCGVVRNYPYPSAQETQELYRNYRTYKGKQSAYLTDGAFDLYCRDKSLTLADLGFDALNFQGKRLLDVGCATGQFLQFAGGYKPSLAEGLDVSPEVIECAKARGLNCRVADFLTVTTLADIVTMWHVIEHVPNPVAYFRHVSQLLVSGGSFLVETPIVGPIAEAFGADWRFFMPVEHLHLFSQAALFKMASQCGFSIRSWITFGSGNDTGAIPQANKRAMDAVAKQMGLGDTLAVWLTKT